jgi:hypothetical protein
MHIWYTSYNFGLRTWVRVPLEPKRGRCMQLAFGICNGSFFVKTWVRVWLLPAQGVLNSCNPVAHPQIGNTCRLWISR